MPVKPDHRSVDPAAIAMLKIADQNQIDNVLERLEKQQPQCGYGQLGTCCRICSQGPCRIDPLGEGLTQGVCGASAHSDHGRKVALLLKAVATGKNTDYQIVNEEKLQGIAAKLSIPADGLTTLELADKVADAALDCFGSQTEEPIQFAAAYMPKRLQKQLGKAKATLKAQQAPASASCPEASIGRLWIFCTAPTSAATSIRSPWWPRSCAAPWVTAGVAH